MTTSCEVSAEERSEKGAPQRHRRVLRQPVEISVPKGGPFGVELRQGQRRSEMTG